MPEGFAITAGRWDWHSWLAVLPDATGRYTVVGRFVDFNISGRVQGWGNPQPGAYGF